jgi:hypothetical protein
VTNRWIAIVASLPVAVAMAAPAFAAGPYEPNDTAQQATPLQAYTTYNAAIETDGDLDWFVFTLPNPQQINVLVNIDNPTSTVIVPDYGPIWEFGVDLFKAGDDGSLRLLSDRTADETLPSVKYLAELDPGTYYLELGVGASTGTSYSFLVSGEFGTSSGGGTSGGGTSGGGDTSQQVAVIKARIQGLKAQIKDARHRLHQAHGRSRRRAEHKLDKLLARLKQLEAQLAEAEAGTN